MKNGYWINVGCWPNPAANQQNESRISVVISDDQRWLQQCTYHASDWQLAQVVKEMDIYRMQDVIGIRKARETGSGMAKERSGVPRYRFEREFNQHAEGVTAIKSEKAMN